MAQVHNDSADAVEVVIYGLHFAPGQTIEVADDLAATLGGPLRVVAPVVPPVEPPAPVAPVAPPVAPDNVAAAQAELAKAQADLAAAESAQHQAAPAAEGSAQ